MLLEFKTRGGGMLDNAGEVHGGWEKCCAFKVIRILS